MQGDVTEFTVHTLRPTLDTLGAIVEVSIIIIHIEQFLCDTKQLSCVCVNVGISLHTYHK